MEGKEGEEKMRMYPKERLFANLLNRQKRKWVYQPKRFKVGNSHYVPDFYLPDEKLYIEVVGTRQAYHTNKKKIEEFKKIYSRTRFIILDYTGKNYLEAKEIKRNKRLKENQRKAVNLSRESWEILLEVKCKTDKSIQLLAEEAIKKCYGKTK